MERFSEKLISDRIAIWAIPVLLVTVAVVHFVLVQTTNLTQWKGGGFGMFSTLDSASNRWVRVYARGPDGRESPLKIPEELRLLKRRVQSQPLQGRAIRLGRKLIERDWNTTSPSGHRRTVKLQSVRIEVWTGRYSSEGPRTDAEKLFEVTVNGTD